MTFEAYLCCIDHDRFEDGCSECATVLRLYRAGWHHRFGLDPNLPDHRTEDEAAAVEAVVDEMRDEDLYVWARLCERILHRHLGPVIEVRPERREDAA